jgi:hypothetical protein
MKVFFAVLATLSLFSIACRSTKAFSNKLTSGSSESTRIEKLLIITDQNQLRILIANVDTKEIVWEWKAVDGGVELQDLNWFDAPSDAKPVVNGKYILMTASKGGVALIRIKDKKAVFYAYAGGNTHSAAILPDGNIVSASSTGNFLMIFHVDTFHNPTSDYSKKFFLPFAHNVVWDNKRQVLWSAGKNKLYSFRYNFNYLKPGITVIDSALIPDNDAHDLFSVYGKDSLYLTTPEGIYKISPDSKKSIKVAAKYTQNIKNVSSGPAGFSTLILLPKEKWWTDEILDDAGVSVFKKEGLKIYKARWFLPDLLAGDSIKNFEFIR